MIIKKINFLKEQVYAATELLSGIFSEAITEKECAVIEKELTAFFKSNTSNAAAALREFNSHLEAILNSLMNGEAEEQQQKETARQKIEPGISVEGVELPELVKQTIEAGYILSDKETNKFKKPGDPERFYYYWNPSHKFVAQPATPEGTIQFKRVDKYQFKRGELITVILRTD